jgi:hypothetical protein
MTKSNINRRLLLGAGFGVSGSLLYTQFAIAQDLSKILGAIGSNNAGASNGVLGLPSGVTNAQADTGIREALTNGAIGAVLRLGRLDGYWADGAVRIPLPNPLGSLQRNLRPLGLSRQLDDLQLKVNRAAEAAAPQAREIFVNAIRSFSISDVVSIVRGGNTSGTDLLKQKTKPDLMARFRPPMLASVNSSGAGPVFDRVSNRYGRELQRLGGLNNISGSQISQNASPKDQFVDYAVSKALDGLFYYIGREETQIRQNPASRTTEILRRVFGGN